MKSSQDVRDYAAEQGIGEKEALTKGMQEKAIEFLIKRQLGLLEGLGSKLFATNKKPAKAGFLLFGLV